MNYIFGKFQTSDLTTQDIDRLLAQADQIKTQFAQVPLDDILNIFKKLKLLWGAYGAYYQKAFRILLDESFFDPETIKMSLDYIPKIFDPLTLRERIACDFSTTTDNLLFFDKFAERKPFKGKQRFVPHGILLHVTAGNIFLGALDSLALGLITKNISIIKLSSKNQNFPMLFAQSLIEADKEGILINKVALLQWKGGDAKIEQLLKNKVDALVCWGGADMLRSYKKDLPPRVVLIEHGPKFSFQFITQKALAQKEIKNIASLIAKDICLWDQAACASPQNLFLQGGIDHSALLNEVSLQMDALTPPRGTLTPDEEAEILKEKFRAIATKAEGRGQYFEGKDSFIHFDPRVNARLSPLNRTLIVKKFNSIDDLLSQLAPVKSLLQSCSYLAHESEKEEYLNRLAEYGVLRFSRLGTIMTGSLGAPHDGRLSILELGRLIPEETPFDILTFVNRKIQRNDFYHNLYQGNEIKDFSELKSVDALNYPFLQKDSVKGGYVFSTGGTTGKPKYIFFTSEEFQETAEMIGRSYKAQGLKAGDLCANLFVAGNLWSSFLAVDKALTHCQAVQLPLGGMANYDFIIGILKKYQPRAVFGIPSLLVEMAFKTKANGEKLNIPLLFYAGEHLTLQAKEFLSEHWGIQEFHSAGYASVDAGPIGYQCKFCEPREHHLFEDKVHLEIIDGQGYVTSSVRKVMPAIHLKTGDHIEWSKGEDCPCGSRDKKFILHGRLDSKIRIWASVVELESIEATFKELDIEAPIFQITLSDPDKLTLKFETEKQITLEKIKKFKDLFYKNSVDLANTLSRDFIENRLLIESVPPGYIPHVERTGKTKPIIDLRTI